MKIKNRYLKAKIWSRATIKT